MVWVDASFNKLGLSHQRLASFCRSTAWITIFSIFYLTKVCWRIISVDTFVRNICVVLIWWMYSIVYLCELIVNGCLKRVTLIFQFLLLLLPLNNVNHPLVVELLKLKYFPGRDRSTWAHDLIRPVSFVLSFMYLQLCWLAQLNCLLRIILELIKHFLKVLLVLGHFRLKLVKLFLELVLKLLYA